MIMINMSYQRSLMRQHSSVFSPDSQSGEREQAAPERVNSLVSLPSEILNVIAQFLSVKDILSCSATCTRLRTVFNDNIIWRKFCKQNVIRYLKKAKRKIEVKYDISSLTYDLDPVCDERMHYIEQNQLLNNWKTGNFIVHNIDSFSCLYYMGLKSGTPIIFEDIYLFLYDFYTHNITVWDIEDVPVPYTDISLLYHNYCYNGLYYEIVGKKLVVLNGGRFVQIYDINLPDKTLPLVCMILTDNNEPLNEIPVFNNQEGMYAVCYHRVIENKIYSRKLSKPILHIWDIETGMKFKALKPPKDCSEFKILSAANSGNDLILCLEISDHQRQFNALGIVYEVFSYSFTTNLFKTFWTNKEASSSTYFPFQAIQHEDLVILFCRLTNYFNENASLGKTILVLYDIKSGVIIGEKSFPELVCYQQILVVNSQLLLATAFCLYVMDLKSHEIVNSFKYECGKADLLNVFDGNFIITTTTYLLAVSNTKRNEIWDIKNRRRCVNITYVLKSPYAENSVFVNQSFTKMVVVGKGTLDVLNFW